MSMDFIEPVLIAAIATLTSAIASVLKAYQLKKSQATEQTIEDRISKLTGSLQETSHLISEIEQEIKTRSELVTKLQQDAIRYNQLKELNQQQVEAIAQTLRGELKVEGRKTFWSGFWLNFVFFGLGVAVTYIIE